MIRFFDFRCPNHGPHARNGKFELLIEFADRPPDYARCPKCDATAPRILSAPAVKGDHEYVVDFPADPTDPRKKHTLTRDECERRLDMKREAPALGEDFRARINDRLERLVHQKLNGDMPPPRSETMTPDQTAIVEKGLRGEVHYVE